MRYLDLCQRIEEGEGKTKDNMDQSFGIEYGNLAITPRPENLEKVCCLWLKLSCIHCVKN